MMELITWILAGFAFICTVLAMQTGKDSERLSNICKLLALVSFAIAFGLLIFTVNHAPHIVEDQYMPVAYP